MNDLSLYAAVNSLGYGQVAKNLIPELAKLGSRVSLFPIGNIQCEQEYIEDVQLALKNAETFNPAAPSVKIWHQHDLAARIGYGPHYALPIFELDTFTSQEKVSLNSVSILNCSKWASSVLNSNNITTNTEQVVPLGVSDVFYPEPFIKKIEGKLRILNMGKWEIRKGHDLIPDILLSAFPVTNFELIMCNHNPFLTEQQENSWQNYYRSKLGDKVIFIPRLKTHKEVADLMRSCHIGLFPSRAEGWNLEALEMLAVGRPIVTSNYSAHTEFVPEECMFSVDGIEPAVDGIWFKGQGNWARIETIEKIAKKLREAYSIYASSNIYEAGVKVGEEYTWQNSAKKLLKAVSVNQ